MSTHQINTDTGTITLNDNAIQSLLENAVSECLTSQHIGGLELLSPSGTRVADSEAGGIDATIYVQMTYGAILTEIISNLRSSLQQKIQSLAELDVSKINICVEKIHVPDTMKT